MNRTHNHALDWFSLPAPRSKRTELGRRIVSSSSSLVRVRFSLSGWEGRGRRRIKWKEERKNTLRSARTHALFLSLLYGEKERERERVRPLRGCEDGRIDELASERPLSGFLSFSPFFLFCFQHGRTDGRDVREGRSPAWPRGWKGKRWKHREQNSLSLFSNFPSSKGWRRRLASLCYAKKEVLLLLAKKWNHRANEPALCIREKKAQVNLSLRLHLVLFVWQRDVRSAS